MELFTRVNTGHSYGDEEASFNAQHNRHGQQRLQHNALVALASFPWRVKLKNDISCSNRGRE